MEVTFGILTNIQSFEEMVIQCNMTQSVFNVDCRRGKWACTYFATPSLMYSDSSVTPMCALRTFLDTGLQSSSSALLEGGKELRGQHCIRILPGTRPLPILYSRVLYSRVLYSRVLYSRVLHSRVLYSTVLYSRELYSRVLYSRVLYYTVVYI